MFPRAKGKDGSFYATTTLIDTDSIITSGSYPFEASMDYDIQWIINFETKHFAKFVFTNVSLSGVI